MECLPRGAACQVGDHVLHGGEVGRRVIGADACLVVAENHVHDPMQAVLDSPMSAHDRGNESRRQGQRGNVVARLGGDLAVDLAKAFNHDDNGQAGPVVALTQPFDIVGNRDGLCLDTAVACHRLLPRG